MAHKVQRGRAQRGPGVQSATGASSVMHFMDGPWTLLFNCVLVDNARFVLHTAVLTIVATMAGISPECEEFAVPALCHYMFPLCDPSSPRPRARRLCRTDCLQLQQRVCKAEYASLGRTAFMGTTRGQGFTRGFFLKRKF